MLQVFLCLHKPIQLLATTRHYKIETEPHSCLLHSCKPTYISLLMVQNATVWFLLRVQELQKTGSSGRALTKTLIIITFLIFFLSFKAFFYIKKDILKVYFRKFAKEVDRFPYFNCYFRSLQLINSFNAVLFEIAFFWYKFTKTFGSIIY